MAAGRVAVIGAGLAGLAAAIDLADAGWNVELFERSRLLGGRATSFTIDGIEVDNGQHVFLGCCTEFLDFVARVGMAKHLHMQDRFDVVVLTPNGSASRLRAVGLPAPWHLVGSFLGYRHLRWPSKLKVARALADAGRARGSMEPFADWLAQRGQTEDALRAFWRPFLVPALNAPLEEITAADAAGVLSTAFLGDAGASRFGYAKVPLAHIADAAAKRAQQLHVSTAVAEVNFASNGSHEHELVLSRGEKFQFEAVVLAVAPPQLQRLVGSMELLGLPSLDGFVPHAIVDVHLWHDRGSLGFDFAALLDAAVQWIFEKSPGYLCCSMSAADSYINSSTEEVTQRCWQEVRAAIPALAGAQLVRSAMTRNPEATYTARRGQRKPGPQTSFPSVAIAGSWTDTGWPDTMESAVRSGRAAARYIADAQRGVRVA